MQTTTPTVYKLNLTQRLVCFPARQPISVDFQGRIWLADVSSAFERTAGSEPHSAKPERVNFRLSRYFAAGHTPGGAEQSLIRLSIFFRFAGARKPLALRILPWRPTAQVNRAQTQCKSR